MKQLKYLKLFEAFESIKLTKTLGYIDKESKDRFISQLKGICDKLSFPLSQLNDEMFQYLPYSKALKVDVKKEEKPCVGTSISLFGSGHGIKGEKCEGGRIKRMWGSRVRTVECPNCGGKGIEPPKEQLKIIKFWFTKDGQMVTTTGCDGTQKKLAPVSITGYKIKNTIYSDNRDWRDRLMSIEHLTPIILKTNNNAREIKAIFYKENSDLFCIQDTYDGGHPSGRTWRSFGRYSWNVSGRDFYSISILEPGESDEEEKTEIDPLTYNYQLQFGWRGDLSLDKRRNVEEFIKNAHFALVFDYEKLKESDTKKVPEIRSEREELKSGSKLTVTDEMVRKQNIQRYMNKIAERSDVVSDVSNVKAVTSRMIGSQYCLYIVIPRSRFEDNFSRIINKYLEIMALKEREYDGTSHYVDGLKQFIKDSYETTSGDINDIRKSLTYCRNKLSQDPDKKVYLDLLNTLDEVSKQINEKILSLPFDCIEDLEVVKSKILSIRNLFNADTYNLSNLRYFIDSVNNGREQRSLNYLIDEWRLQGDNLENTIKGLETAKKIISRL